MKTFFMIFTILFGVIGFYFMILGDRASSGMYYGVASFNFCCYLLASRRK